MIVLSLAYRRAFAACAFCMFCVKCACTQFHKHIFKVFISCEKSQTDKKFVKNGPKVDMLSVVCPTLTVISKVLVSQSVQLLAKCRLVWFLMWC